MEDIDDAPLHGTLRSVQPIRTPHGRPEDEVALFVAVDDVAPTLTNADKLGGHNCAVGSRGPKGDLWGV